MKHALLGPWTILQVPGTSQWGSGAPAGFHDTYIIRDVSPSQVWLVRGLRGPFSLFQSFLLVLVFQRDEDLICVSGSRMALGPGFKSGRNAEIWEYSLCPAGFSGFERLVEQPEVLNENEKKRKFYIGLCFCIFECLKNQMLERSLNTGLCVFANSFIYLICSGRPSSSPHGCSLHCWARCVLEP